MRAVFCLKEMKYFLIIFALATALVSCGQKQQKTADEQIAPATFSADSAYAYVKAQVDMGARVPGTAAHQQCLAYLQASLERFGMQTAVEQGTLPRYDGKPQPIFNVVGRYRPDLKERILLCAHWDCRPWSDHETDPQKQQIPVLGANDGASGVGVLLEIARQLQIQQPEAGVDIVFFDAEDMGTPEFYEGEQRENSWCLGSQLWAEQHKAEKADYGCGILLDMIGAPDAVFGKEYFSMQYAADVLQHIWKTASKIGYSRWFLYRNSGAVTDDHYYVNTLAGIPTIDIIHYDPQNGTGFPAYWHTNHDDMRNVSRSSLDAVGTTLMTAICNNWQLVR